MKCPYEYVCIKIDPPGNNSTHCLFSCYKCKYYSSKAGCSANGGCCEELKWEKKDEG